MERIIDEHTETFIAAHAADDVRNLALQAGRYPEVDMRTAVTQIEGRQLAVHKLPTWAATEGLVYPVRLSMEQCSSELTARYKAGLVRGERLTDLTGGFGIDCSYMSASFREATYVERNAELCRIARHNMQLLKLPVRVVNGECEEWLSQMEEQDWLFLDPARRDGAGKKVVALADCEPDVSRLEPLLLEKAAKVMIKCSPMLDITLACRELKQVQEVHVVSVNNECKELLLILNRGVAVPEEERVIHAVHLHHGQQQDFAFTSAQEAEAVCRYAVAVKRYLYEPNSSLMKAGCFRLPAVRYGLEKLHRNSHLYTADQWVKDFPGRVFEVMAWDGWNKAALKALTGGLQKANIAVRNFPETPEVIRKKLKLKEGGEDFLFATTLADDRKVLIHCKRVDLSAR